MLTIKDLGAKLAETTVNIRGREIPVRPLSAVRSTLLLSLNPAPPETAPDYPRLRTLWVTNVELHEAAVLIDLAVLAPEISLEPTTFPWDAQPDVQRRWLELARRQLGELLSRREVQAIVLAADRAGAGAGAGAAGQLEEARKN
ncbi:MAG: hypothetical protein AB7O32_00205 [Vicinamibacterales bacterium]